MSFVIGPLVVKDIKCELDTITPSRGNLSSNVRSALIIIGEIVK